MSLSIIRALVERQIPVCGHIGLQPQSVHALGGYRVQGKDAESAENISHAAALVEESGASLLLLECVPGALAERISRERSIPTIGIGAGVNCDGQVLVVR